LAKKSKAVKSIFGLFCNTTYVSDDRNTLHF
jgi:hypothetical protein